MVSLVPLAFKVTSDVTVLCGYHDAELHIGSVVVYDLVGESPTLIRVKSPW
jgi:hypothetical protein